MRYIFFCFFILFFCGKLSAQANADVFPESFVGNWKGDAKYFVEKGLKRTNPGGIIIQPVNGKPKEYTWQFMLYEEWAKNDRIFILKPAGDKPNHWLLDEQDGIVIDGYSFGNSFQCMFEIKGEIVCMNFKLLDGKMYNDFTTTDADVLNRTGKGTDFVPFANNRKVKKFETAVYEKQR